MQLRHPGETNGSRWLSPRWSTNLRSAGTLTGRIIDTAGSAMVDDGIAEARKKPGIMEFPMSARPCRIFAKQKHRPCHTVCRHAVYPSVDRRVTFPYPVGRASALAAGSGRVGACSANRFDGFVLQVIGLAVDPIEIDTRYAHEPRVVRVFDRMDDPGIEKPHLAGVSRYSLFFSSEISSSSDPSSVRYHSRMTVCSVAWP